MQSVFTQAIVEGLRTGDADRDKDGLITVTDIYHHVYDRVRAAEPRQTPELWTYGGEGDVLLAYSVRGAVIEPVALPEDLRVTLESPRPGVRETAVAELAELLDVARPGLALSARHALQQISDEDIPRVAAVARVALEASQGTAAREVGRNSPTATTRAGRQEAQQTPSGRPGRRPRNRPSAKPAGDQAEGRGTGPRGGTGPQEAQQAAERQAEGRGTGPAHQNPPARKPSATRRKPQPARRGSHRHARARTRFRRGNTTSTGPSTRPPRHLAPPGRHRHRRNRRRPRPDHGDPYRLQHGHARCPRPLDLHHKNFPSSPARRWLTAWSTSAVSTTTSTPSTPPRERCVGLHHRGMQFSSPAVIDGMVYIGSRDHKVYAMDAATGNVRWHYITGTNCDFISGGGGCHGLRRQPDRQRLRHGRRHRHGRWRFVTGDAVDSSPAVADGMVYVGSGDGGYAIDAATGQVRWRYITGGLVSPPAVVGGMVYIGSDRQGVRP